MPLLLTRPKAQGTDFARHLQARFGSQLNVISTPLLVPEIFDPVLPSGPFSALILTSQTGVASYVRLFAKHDLPKDVFCVGERTAHAAVQAGLTCLSHAQDAASLILQIRSLRPKGRLLHLRGRETRGNINALLDLGGIDTVDAIVYAQNSRQLTPHAIATLRGGLPVLAPLFSPRTAALFNLELARIHAVSPLFVAAMSSEVALELRATNAQIKVSDRPDACAMADTIALLLQDLQRA